jgi:hypothetical protein
LFELAEEHLKVFLFKDLFGCFGDPLVEDALDADVGEDMLDRMLNLSSSEGQLADDGP